MGSTGSPLLLIFSTKACAHSSKGPTQFFVGIRAMSSPLIELPPCAILLICPHIQRCPSHRATPVPLACNNRNANQPCELAAVFCHRLLQHGLKRTWRTYL